MGQGNSIAGGQVLDRMFNKGPYGMNISKMRSGSPRMPRMSSMSKMSSLTRTKGMGFAMGGLAQDPIPQSPSVNTQDMNIIDPYRQPGTDNMASDMLTRDRMPIYPSAPKRTFIAPIPRKFAPGGTPHNGHPAAPIVAAGGEYVVHPDSVARIGGGDIDVGHDILDRFVKMQRDKHIKDLKGLKPPKGSDAANGRAYGGRTHYQEGGGSRPWNRRTDTSARPWQRKYGTDEEAMAASQAQTKASQMREKDLNASIRATRDQPMTEFEENPTHQIDRLINKWQTGSIYGNELDQLKGMLQERYNSPRPVTSGIAVPIARPSLQSAGAPLGPETQQYRGGRTAYARGGGLKLSKKSVQYTDHGHKDAKCGICKHFRDGHCAIVSGPIAAAGWCNRFAKK